MSESKAPNLELVYFAVRARAEPIRMMLAYGKVSYKDTIATGQKWRDDRSAGRFPFGQLPVLFITGTDGKQTAIAQTASIARYVAGLTGLIPTDPVRAAVVDSISEGALELYSVNPIVNIYRGETFTAKKAAYFSENMWGRRLPNLAKFAPSGSSGFMGSEPKPTYADFILWHAFSNALLLEPKALDGYKDIQVWMDRVAGLPGVKEYLAARPDAVQIGTAPILRAKKQ